MAKSISTKTIICSLFSLLTVVAIVESKLQVPFQEFATPKPEIASKIYYLQDYCEICEKFRPDFTRIKKPANVTDETVNNEKSLSEAEPVTNNKDKLPTASLKRVPREISNSSSLSDKKEDKPEIILLNYDQDSGKDGDMDNNGTWSWQKAFKKIKAKWIEKFGNNTARQVENKMTAKLKMEKEGDEQTKKIIIEFKKKIQNLTLLNDDGPKNSYEVVDEETPTKISPEKKEERVLVKRELKQIFLDPIEQPSIVIRTKRSTTNDSDEILTETEIISETSVTTMATIVTTSEQVDQSNETDSSQNKTGKYEKCRLLIRFKNPIQNQTEIDLKDAEVPKSEKNETKNKESKSEKLTEENKLEDKQQELKIEEKKLEESTTKELKPESKSEKKKHEETISEENKLEFKQKEKIESLKTEQNKSEESIKSKETKLKQKIPENADFGLMVNIRKFVGSVLETVADDFNRTTQKRLENNPFWKNIKIFTSDPDMTEYWVEGEKIDSTKNVSASSRTKRSTSSVPSVSVKTPPIDMIDMEDIVHLLTQNDTDLNILNEKWILLERKIFFDDPDADNDEELIINLFFKPKEQPESIVQLRSSNRDHRKLECPEGTFDCNLNGSLCIPESLICNGEDNCGNAEDEMNCGNPSFNVYYVYNEKHQLNAESESSSFFMFDANTQGMFWLATRILFILFATSLFLYILLLLCRMCDRLRSDPTPAMFILPKGNYISITGDTIERKPWPPTSHSKLHGYRTLHGSQMDTHGSKIREYIYVNNNYGQPQGSTVVTTDVQPPSYKKGSKRHSRRQQPQQYNSDSPDISENDEYPPLYEESVRHYGTKK